LHAGAGDLAHRKGRAAARVAVEFDEHDAGERQRRFEGTVYVSLDKTHANTCHALELSY